MTRLSTVAIVGAGMIGGSIGLALRRCGAADRIIGIGRRQASLRVARRVGAVTNTTVDLAKGVAEADLVVVCTPVGRIVDDVREAARHCRPGTLLTDVGSTKATIVEALDGASGEGDAPGGGLAQGCRFLGGHPVAGSEKTGAGNAQADLFDGRLTILTPTRNTRAEDYDLLEGFWQTLGAVVVQMSPDDHDRALAVTSHLPHVASAALATTVPESMFRFSGTGILDATRLAGGDPDLWRQILTLNRRHVLSALEQFGSKLAALHAAIRDDNQAELLRLLTLAKKNRDALGS